MSINHGHVCAKSFLTRSHLWLFNYKQEKNNSTSRLEVDLCLCVGSVFFDGLTTPSPSSPSCWSLSLPLHIKSQCDTADHQSWVMQICDLCWPRAFCRFLTPFSTCICAQTLFHLKSAEKRPSKLPDK